MEQPFRLFDRDDDSMRHGMILSVIQTKKDSDLPNEESKAQGEKQLAAVKTNHSMFSCIMAFASEGLNGLIYKFKSKAWPTGLAYMVRNLLFKKFAPDDTMSFIELEAQLKTSGPSMA